MTTEILTNRLDQPIPEKCPLSEAVVWLITGCPPISIDDYKIINHSSLRYSGPDVVFMSLDTDMPEMELYAIDAKNQKVTIEENDFSIAKDKLLVALRKGNVKAWGEYGDFQVDDPIMLEKNNYQLIGVWNSYFKEEPALYIIDSEYRQIPSNLWSWEIVDWFNNILHYPLNGDYSAQFSDVAISTDDLFNHFHEKGSDTSIPQIETSKRGRPAIVEMELWLEELAVLFLTGKATEKDNREYLATSLKDSLLEHHGKKISLETVRKDWIRPLFVKAKERNGGK